MRLQYIKEIESVIIMLNPWDYEIFRDPIMVKMIYIICPWRVIKSHHRNHLVSNLVPDEEYVFVTIGSNFMIHLPKKQITYETVKFLLTLSSITVCPEKNLDLLKPVYDIGINFIEINKKQYGNF